MIGILFCIFGLGFGMIIYMRLQEPARASFHARNFRTDLRDLQDIPHHPGQIHPADLVAFIAVIIRALFRRALASAGKPIAVTLPIILVFSLVGIAGSYGVAWFGIRVNTFANSRTAFASPCRQALSRSTRFRCRPA